MDALQIDPSPNVSVPSGFLIQDCQGKPVRNFQTTVVECSR